MKHGINSAGMQKNNRLLVFRTLLEMGSMTRATLSKILNLNKATMTNIIHDFYELGIVDIDGDEAAGRRGEKLCLKLDDLFLLSMGITRKDYQLNIFTLYGKCCKKITYRFKPGEALSEIVHKMQKDAALLLEEYGSDRIIGVSLAVPGLFINRPEKGEEIFAVSEFEELGQVNIRERLESALGKKIVLKHDAKLSAYAEWRCAEEIHGVEKASLAVVRSKGFGIGMGFVVNGAIMNGHLGLAGEVGYMGINYNGKRRSGEREGTYEYYAGTESAIRYVRDSLWEFPDSPLTEDSTYRDIIRAYEQKDALAVRAVNKMAWMLGYGLANIIYIVNPDCIIIGSEYPDNDDFLQKVRASIREHVPAYVEECTTIRYSRLSEDSFLLGGYYYMLENLLKGDIIELIKDAKGL